YATLQRLEQNAALAQILQFASATNQALELLGRAVKQREKMPCAHINYLYCRCAQARRIREEEGLATGGRVGGDETGKGAILSRKSWRAQIGRTGRYKRLTGSEWQLKAELATRLLRLLSGTMRGNRD